MVVHTLSHVALGYYADPVSYEGKIRRPASHDGHRQFTMCIECQTLPTSVDLIHSSIDLKGRALGPGVDCIFANIGVNHGELWQ